MSNKIEELDAQIAELTAKRDALLKVGKRWRAETEEKFWTILSDGSIRRYYENRSVISNDYIYSYGNYFRTEAEAQHALKRMIATQQLKDRIAELNAAQGWTLHPFDEAYNNHFPCYSSDLGVFCAEEGTSFHCTPIEFYGSRETIETVIAEMPEQIKLWLGVE